MRHNRINERRMNAALRMLVESLPPDGYSQLKDGTLTVVSWDSYERNGELGIRCSLSFAVGSEHDAVELDLPESILPANVAGIKDEMEKAEKSLEVAALVKLTHSKRLPVPPNDKSVSKN